jgi:hypothetical protein
LASRTADMYMVVTPTTTPLAVTVLTVIGERRLSGMAMAASALAVTALDAEALDAEVLDTEVSLVAASTGGVASAVDPPVAVAVDSMAVEVGTVAVEATGSCETLSLYSVLWPSQIESAVAVRTGQERAGNKSLRDYINMQWFSCRYYGLRCTYKKALSFRRSRPGFMLPPAQHDWRPEKHSARVSG